MNSPSITPAQLRDSLIVDNASGSGPALLREIQEDWQTADYPALDSAMMRAAGYGADGPAYCWLERPRGHAKSSTIAILIVWFLLASRFARSGLVAASDQDQGALLLKAVSKLLEFNRQLGQFLEVLKDRVRHKATGSEVVIVSSDLRSSWGHNVQFICMEELSVWAERRLFDSLISSAAKRGDCAVIAIMNAGFQDSWVWPVREGVRQDHAWYFSRLDEPRAGWITTDRLQSQRRILPRATYDRVWLNRWVPSSGDALDPDEIHAAVTLAGPTFMPKPGHEYILAADLGIARDATAACVLGIDVGTWETKSIPEQPVIPGWRMALADLRPDEFSLPSAQAESVFVPGTGKIELARMVVFAPSGGNNVSLTEVEQCLVDLHNTYNFSAVAIDPWQAALLLERLQEKRLPASALTFTAENLRAMAQATLDAFRERQLSIYEDPVLIADLKALRVKETGQSFRLEASRSARGQGTRHADTATALAIALCVARRLDSYRAATVPGELICWP